MYLAHYFSAPPVGYLDVEVSCKSNLLAGQTQRDEVESIEGESHVDYSIHMLAADFFHEAAVDHAPDMDLCVLFGLAGSHDHF